MSLKAVCIAALALICALTTCTSTAFETNNQGASKERGSQVAEQRESKEKSLETIGQLQGKQVEACPDLASAGAEKVGVVIVGDSDVLLVGTSGERVVWQKRFPLQREINSAKVVITCKERSIEIASEAPYSAAISTQAFSWDGQNLEPTSGAQSKDSSAETVEEAIKAAEEGNAAKLQSVDLDSVLYPQNYINGPTLIAALQRGHKAALALYQQQQPREAAERLALMFQLTVKLSNVVTGNNDEPNSLASWLESWRSQGVEPKDYAQILGDYGYFLQQAGRNEAAIPVFEAVTKESPSYAAAYLNLADSLWSVGRKVEAKSNYETYQRLMSTKGNQEKVPQRVVERTNRTTVR